MTNIMPLLRLSDNDEWPTPQHVFDALDAEFGFTLDVCADGSNHKCPRYFDRERETGFPRAGSGSAAS